MYFATLSLLTTYYLPPSVLLIFALHLWVLARYLCKNPAVQESLYFWRKFDRFDSPAAPFLPVGFPITIQLFPGKSFRAKSHVNFHVVSSSSIKCKSRSLALPLQSNQRWSYSYDTRLNIEIWYKRAQRYWSNRRNQNMMCLCSAHRGFFCSAVLSIWQFYIP